MVGLLIQIIDWWKDVVEAKRPWERKLIRASRDKICRDRHAKSGGEWSLVRLDTSQDRNSKKTCLPWANLLTLRRFLVIIGSLRRLFKRKAQEKEGEHNWDLLMWEMDKPAPFSMCILPPPVDTQLVERLERSWVT